jgi:hypothetical protein
MPSGVNRLRNSRRQARKQGKKPSTLEQDLPIIKLPGTSPATKARADKRTRRIGERRQDVAKRWVGGLKKAAGAVNKAASYWPSSSRSNAMKKTMEKDN